MTDSLAIEIFNIKQGLQNIAGGVGENWVKSHSNYELLLEIGKKQNIIIALVCIAIGIGIAILISQHKTRKMLRELMEKQEQKKTEDKP